MSNVEYDIFKSKYFVIFNDFIFYFSSEFNKNRFKERLNEFINNETNKLKAKYHVNIRIPVYLSFVLYKRIEKRGYRIEFDNDDRTLIPENFTFFDLTRM